MSGGEGGACITAGGFPLSSGCDDYLGSTDVHVVQQKESRTHKPTVFSWELGEDETLLQEFTEIQKSKTTGLVGILLKWRRGSQVGKNHFLVNISRLT